MLILYIFLIAILSLCLTEMRVQLIICSILIFCLNSVKGQDKKSSYSKNKREYIKSAVEADVPQLLEKARAIKAKNPLQALEYVEEALLASKQQNYVTYEASCYYLIGEINADIEEWGLAIENYQKAKTLFVQTKNNGKAQDTRFAIATCYRAQKKVINARTFYELFLNNATTTAEKFKGNTALGDLVYDMNNYEKALLYYQKALKYAEQTKNKVDIGFAKANLAKVYAFQNQNDDAEGLLEESQEIMLQNNTVDKGTYYKDYSPISEAKEQVIVNYRSQNNFKDEIRLRESSLNRADSTTALSSGMTRSKVTLDDEYRIKENRELGESYLASGNIDKAIPQLEKSIKLASSSNLSEEKAQGYKALSEAFAQNGQYSKALEKYELYVLEKEKILSEREVKLLKNKSVIKRQSELNITNKDLELYQKDIDIEQKDKDLLQAQYKRQKIISYSLLLLLVIVMIGAYLIYKNAKEKRKANQLLILKSLRSQMNPHFIFNALNSVNSFISKNDEKSANKFLAEFSKLMRMVLENSQEDFVPLGQELMIIELYLKLEQYRFRDKFEYDYILNGDIDTDNFQIPPMLIQPFIENAVWHGLRYKETFGKLTVTLTQIEKDLVVTIVDDGIGRKKSMELKTKNQEKNSKGLKNTKECIVIINTIYRKRYNLQIRDLDSMLEDSGTHITLTLPLT